MYMPLDEVVTKCGRIIPWDRVIEIRFAQDEDKVMSVLSDNNDTIFDIVTDRDELLSVSLFKMKELMGYSEDYVVEPDAFRRVMDTWRKKRFRMFVKGD